MALDRKPLIGITMGDPCGVGPEVTLRALSSPEVRQMADFAVFGSDAVLRRVAEAFGLGGVRWWRCETLTAPPAHGAIPLVDAEPVLADLALRGEPTAEGGRASGRWIEQAVRAALAGAIDAVVTAPINKEALRMGGYDWPGHTEMIAALCKVRKPVMMMAGEGLRVALVTTHMAIADLPKCITRDAVLETIRVTHKDLMRRFGLSAPRLAVCGLNPHAGEAARFGREEEREIGPAVEAARRDGMDCVGPVPADSAFLPARRRQCDAVVAMYHDQACIPVKMLAFETGVNITLGLPIVRTSPDHGTAYDIVRRGVAQGSSTAAAVRVACEMVAAERRAP